MLKDCPARVVAKCAKSPLWLERCVVAQHLTTPKKLLQTLVHDTNETVRAAAQWRLERGMQTSDRRAKARAVALSMTRGRSQLARRIPKRHRTVLFKGDPVKIAKVLDRLLEGANGARRAVMSHKTVSSLLRLVISKEQLAWARSHQTKYGSSSATLALCARINKNELCIAIARGSAHNASPGGTWPDLRPWRPALKRTTEKLKDWLGTGSADRARLTMSKATAVASALMKLPPQKIKWHKGGWSDSNEIFVIRDFTQKHVDIDTTDVR
jgi:hypothetical protein